jgi:hypothetical protein
MLGIKRREFIRLLDRRDTSVANARWGRPRHGSQARFHKDD